MSLRVYVGGLPSDFRPHELMDVFRRYVPDKADMKAGYGFLEFKSQRDADDAVHDMDGYKVDGRRLIVQPARGMRRTGAEKLFEPKKSGFRVDVVGIESRTSWQDLKDFARQAGNVVYADVFVKDGKKTGVIEYSSAEDMQNALRKLDDTKLDGTVVRIYEANKGDRPAAGGDRREDRPAEKKREDSPRGRSRSPRRASHRSRSRSRSPRDRRDHRSRSRTPEKRRSLSPPRKSDDRALKREADL